MNDLWMKHADDFNTMSDEDVDDHTRIAQHRIDDDESWLEAVASWKDAGKPRSSDAN